MVVKLLKRIDDDKWQEKTNQSSLTRTRLMSCRWDGWSVTGRRIEVCFPAARARTYTIHSTTLTTDPDINIFATGFPIKEEERVGKVVLHVDVSKYFTKNTDAPSIFLDLNWVDVVSEYDRASITFDDNFASVDRELILTQVDNTFVLHNHQFGDFSEDCKVRFSTLVGHNDGRVRWVRLLRLFAGAQLFVNNLSPRNWLKQDGELGVIERVADLWG